MSRFGSTLPAGDYPPFGPWGGWYPPTYQETTFERPKVPHKCPVCNGCGHVPAGFYTGSGGATSTANESCRACEGKGIIFT